MKRRDRKPVRRQQDLVGERIVWIDRLVRAIDMQPEAPPGLAHECRQLRQLLCTYRDGVVLGSRLADAQRKLK